MTVDHEPMTPDEVAEERRFRAYLKAEPMERLMEVQRELEAATDQTSKDFLRGRMFELTIDMDEHPDGYSWDCFCAECRDAA